jgi:hypothetical protein
LIEDLPRIAEGMGVLVEMAVVRERGGEEGGEAGLVVGRGREAEASRLLGLEEVVVWV